MVQENEIVGCPDCTDTGAEGIEISYEDGTKRKITFDIGTYLGQVSELAGELRNLRRIFEVSLRKKQSIRDLWIQEALQ